MTPTPIETIGPVYDMAGAARAPVVACAHLHGVIVIRDLASGTQVIIQESVHDQGRSRIAVSPDGALTLVAGYYAGVECYQSATGERLWASKRCREVQDVLFVDGVPWCGARSERGRVRWYHASDGADLGSLSRIDEICPVAGQSAYVSLSGASCRLRRLPDHEVVAEFACPIARSEVLRLCASATSTAVLALDRRLFLCPHNAEEACEAVCPADWIWNNGAARSEGEFMFVAYHHQTRRQGLYSIQSNSGEVRAVAPDQLPNGHACLVNGVRMLVGEYEPPYRIG